MNWNGSALIFALSTGIVFGIVSVPSAGHAQQIGSGKNIGLGLGGGTRAAGITGKYYLGGGSAIQGHLGGLLFTDALDFGAFDDDEPPFDDDDGPPFDDDEDDFDAEFGLSVDYVYEPGSLVTASAGRLFWGVGGGGALYTLGDSGALAVNGVLELGWHFSEIPIELILDYRPFFAFGDGFFGGNIFLPMGFSARFYF